MTPSDRGAWRTAYAKKEAAPVTNADLKEFAGQRIANKRVRTLKTAKFEGIHIEYLSNNAFWREWWLRSGNLMLYVTYNVKAKLMEDERATIDEFISSLEPK